MKIAEINMVTSGSTGKIMLQIAETARAAGHTVRTYSPILFANGKKNKPENIPDHFWWGSRFEQLIHRCAGSLFGANGMLSWFGTRQLVKRLKKFSPDIIHLHNLHAFCVNLPVLFKYIKKSGVKVVWTLHDCWAFTGHCPYFTISGCEKWKTECKKCPQPKVYPKMYFDTSKTMYRKKKKWFSDIPDLTIVTPSEWLADLAKESFFKDRDVLVINNGIDLSVFKPRDTEFRKKHNIKAKYILLGVAFGWGYRKGLDVFVELSKRLDPALYQIVLVGTDENTDAQLPSNIISIHRTADQIELAETYSAADLLVNPTREENYPTVNMESISCGTPVLTFNTGGSPEIPDRLTGSVVECNDVDAMEREIIRITQDDVYSKNACLQRSKDFDSTKCFNRYVDLFDSICKGK